MEKEIVGKFSEVEMRVKVCNHYVSFLWFRTKHFIQGKLNFTVSDRQEGRKDYVRIEQANGY